MFPFKLTNSDLDTVSTVSDLLEFLGRYLCSTRLLSFLTKLTPVGDIRIDTLLMSQIPAVDNLCLALTTRTALDGASCSESIVSEFCRNDAG